MAEQSLSALAGKRIVVTRAEAQSEGLFDALRSRRAEPILFPLIRIVALEDYGALDAALVRLRAGDWIILTSQNAVTPVATRARMLRKEFFGAANGILVAAVGPATAKAAQALNVKVDYVAKTHDGVSLANELKERLRGHLALLPRSDLAGGALPATIQKIGGQAVEVIAYRTERVNEWEGQLVDMILEGAVDAVVCFSPSAVHALTDLLAARDAVNFQDKVAFAAIGAVTAQAFRSAGIRKPLVAVDASAEATVKILSDYFASREQFQNAGATNS